MPRQRRTDTLMPSILVLGLSETNLLYLENRWLKLLGWMDGAAVLYKCLHYVSRTAIALGAVIVPVLVASNSRANEHLSVTISLLVASAAAIDELFCFKDYWRHHRRYAELLRSEGWMYLELVQKYGTYESHDKAFQLFVLNIENLATASSLQFGDNILRTDRSKAA